MLLRKYCRRSLQWVLSHVVILFSLSISLCSFLSWKEATSSRGTLSAFFALGSLLLRATSWLSSRTICLSGCKTAAWSAYRKAYLLILMAYILSFLPRCNPRDRLILREDPSQRRRAFSVANAKKCWLYTSLCSQRGCPCLLGCLALSRPPITSFFNLTTTSSGVKEGLLYPEKLPSLFCLYSRVQRLNRSARMSNSFAIWLVGFPEKQSSTGRGHYLKGSVKMSFLFFHIS